MPYQPEVPPPPEESGEVRRCGRDCHCPRSKATNDLDALLATPGFTGTLLGARADQVGVHLPTLDQVVGVTVAGPAILNDVGTHLTPTIMGGAIDIRPDRISLRLNPARLGAAVVTDPAANIPPTVRLYDAEGNTSHATYLTENSDRLAFEAISMVKDPLLPPTDSRDVEADTRQDRESAGLPDQVDQFDAILDDGGIGRLWHLPAAEKSGYARVDGRRIVGALEHAATLGMPATLGVAGPGCLQLRHGHLDGAREHRGQMVLASGSGRVMVNFNLVAECWVTWSHGVWGPTGSIEIYDRHGQCSLVLTQTGAVAPGTFEAWNQLLVDLAD